MTEQLLPVRTQDQPLTETELNELEGYYNHFVAENGTEHLHAKAVKMIIDDLKSGAPVLEAFDKANSFADQVLADRAKRILKPQS
jgi:hypothetical protein